MFRFYKDFWKNYVNFKGRTSRGDFWKTFVLNFLIFGIGSFLISLTVGPDTFTSGATGSVVTMGRPSAIGFGIGYFLFLYGLVVLLPMLALMTRRLRDARFHWALMFFLFIPLIGETVLLILCLFPTQNQYASNQNLIP